MRPEKNQLVARLLAIFTNLSSESGELITPVLAISANLRPDSNEFIAPFLPIFMKIRPERKQPSTLFLVIFKKCRPERNLLISRFLALFTNLRPERNEFNYFSIFGDFHLIKSSKETTYCSMIFGYFLECDIHIWLFLLNWEEQGMNLFLDVLFFIF